MDSLLLLSSVPKERWYESAKGRMWLQWDWGGWVRNCREEGIVGTHLESSEALPNPQKWEDSEKVTSDKMKKERTWLSIKSDAKQCIHHIRVFSYCSQHTSLHMKTIPSLDHLWLDLFLLPWEPTFSLHLGLNHNWSSLSSKLHLVMDLIPSVLFVTFRKAL